MKWPQTSRIHRTVARQRPSNRTVECFVLDLGLVAVRFKGFAMLNETLVAAGDCVHQRPGIVHYLFDYSPDMEYLEIVALADFETIDVEGPCAVPPVTPWK